MRQLVDKERIERFMQVLGGQARADVERMIDSGLVERTQLLAYFEAIEPDLYRYPAIHPESFRRSVETINGRRDDS